MVKYDMVSVYSNSISVRHFISHTYKYETVSRTIYTLYNGNSYGIILAEELRFLESSDNGSTRAMNAYCDHSL